MCELARNSCVQSGWEMEVKRHWLGPDWYRPGVEGNQIHKTNVPNLRVEYRHATLMEEREMISQMRLPGADAVRDVAAASAAGPGKMGPRHASGDIAAAAMVAGPGL